MVQQSIQLFVLFLSPTLPKSYEATIETAEKTITTTNYIANEAKIGNKCELDYSL